LVGSQFVGQPRVEMRQLAGNVALLVGRREKKKSFVSSKREMGVAAVEIWRARKNPLKKHNWGSRGELRDP